MRTIAILTVWTLFLLAGFGMLGGAALAQQAASAAAGATPVPMTGLPIDLGNLTFPGAFVIVGWMAIRALPAALKDWTPSLKVEHTHILKGEAGPLTRADLEELLLRATGASAAATPDNRAA